MYSTRPHWLMRKIYPSAIWKIVPASDFSSLGRDKRGGEIFLTFDDGPIPEITPWVLSVLKTYNAKATFFCVGANIKKHPELFQQILAEGHSVGNHTYNHLNGWKTKTKDYIDNTEKCKKIITNVHPQSSIIHCPLFRPPYGKLKRSQYSRLITQYSLIMWDVLSGDFDQKLSEEKCLKNVISKTREGSIVVFHDSLKAKKNLFYVLPKFMDHFSKQGFRFDRLHLSDKKNEYHNRTDDRAQ